MGSVIGVSVGTSAVRFVRRDTDANPESFADFSSAAPDRVTEAIGDLVNDANAPNTVMCVASKDEAQAEIIRSLMVAHSFTRYRVVPEVHAALTWLDESGVLAGMSVVALYDFGCSGLSVDVVDLATSDILFSERTSDVGGQVIDAAIGAMQLRKHEALYAGADSTHGISRPAIDRVAFDTSCRTAKEQLSTSNGVCVGSDAGLILLSLSAFELMIGQIVQRSARVVQDALAATTRTVDAVVLIGGGSRIPLVQSTVASCSTVRTVVAESPEWVVARGAGLLAGDQAAELSVAQFAVDHKQTEVNRVHHPEASAAHAYSAPAPVEHVRENKPEFDSGELAAIGVQSDTTINHHWGKAALVAVGILLMLAVFGLIVGSSGRGSADGTGFAPVVSTEYSTPSNPSR